MQIFVGGEVTDTLMAVFGALLFSGKWYLIYKTTLTFLNNTKKYITICPHCNQFTFRLGFIVFDTQMIMKRVSPEEYIVATIELYLDIINLFIEILKIMEKVNRK